METGRQAGSGRCHCHRQISSPSFADIIGLSLSFSPTPFPLSFPLPSLCFFPKPVSRIRGELAQVSYSSHPNLGTSSLFASISANRDYFRSHPVKLDLVRALSPQNSICQYEWSGVERSGGWESHHEMEGRKARYFSPCPISQMPWWEEGAGMEERASFSPSEQMVESIVSRNIDFGNKWESDDVSFHWPSRREGF